MFWSAADILFVTIEIKLFEQVEHVAAGGRTGRPRRDDVTGGLSDPGGGLRPLVAGLACLAHHGAWRSWRMSGSTLDAAFWWRDGSLGWRPSPDLQHSKIFVAGLLLIGYVVARQVKRILLLSQYYEQRRHG